jgi:chromosome partitioning protein
MRTAATYVPKGGVGKTTTAAHIGVAAASEHDLDVLLVDLAGQQNDLATQFGVDALDLDDPQDLVDVIDAPISAVFGDDWDFIRENIPNVLDRMVFATDEGPDLIPADPGLGGADNNLANVPREERFIKLQQFLDEDVADRYDLVLLDLPGKEDNIALNGLFAARNVIAPLKPGAFERNQLEQLEHDLQVIADEYDVPTALTLVFATMVDHRTTLGEEFVADLEAEYPDAAGEPIPATQNIGNEQAAGRTLFALDEDALYTSGQRAREAYRQNTDLLLDRL